ncbi:MAG: hypothetical protein II779_15080 [Clostridia bacterium]|nr:hypothetical protein [Clostridia bacterium]
MKRHLSVLLLLFLLAGSSCSETAPEPSPAPSDDAGTVSEQPAEPEETAPSRIRKDFEIKDMNGKSFHVFSCGPDDGGNWHVHDMTAEELNGEIMNDAVFTRNEFLAETYNYKIEVTETPDPSPNKQIGNFIAAADTTYDTFGVRVYTCAALAVDGNLLDLKALPWISTEEAWWSPSLCGPLTVGGHQYMATGDISVVPKEGVRAYYFNKGLQKDYQLESPYDLVKDGTWTWEKMFSMMHVATTDLDGDGRMNQNDRWGLQGQPLTSYVLYTGSGESLVSKDEEDRWKITAGDERSVDAMLRVSELMAAAKDDVYLTWDWSGMLKMFENNQALFYTEVMLHIETMRGYDVDFGIIPTPKMDEAQQEYSHFIDSTCNIFYTLPVSSPDPDSAAYILETIAYASHFDITPAYYDVCLKAKYSRDEESSAMLDIIFSSYRLEIANAYSLGGLYDSVTNVMSSGGNISSTLAAQQKSSGKILEKTLDKLAEKNNW